MSASAAARVEAPVRSAPVRPRRQTRVRKERRVAGSVVWVAVIGALLAGVVAINVAVLRLKVENDHLGQERVSLLEKKANLASQLSTAAATSHIQDLARKAGLVPASADQTTYVNIGK